MKKITTARHDGVSYRRQNKAEMTVIRNIFYLWAINIKPSKRSKQLFSKSNHTHV